MSQKSLGYLLSSTKRNKQSVASKLDLLRDNPYSQAIVRLQKKQDFNKENIHFKYDWYQCLGSDAFPKHDDLLNVGLVTIGKKKKKKKKVKSIKTVKDYQTDLMELKELITDQESPAIVEDSAFVESPSTIEPLTTPKTKKKKKKRKKKKKKKLKSVKDPEIEQEIILDSTVSEFDDYTKWINNISGIDSFSYGFEKKKKEEEKEKKKEEFITESKD